jgi:hypothetical protein
MTTTTATIEWPGLSGNSYRYEIYRIGTPLKALGGNYVFAKETSPGRWTPVYIGQTANLSERFDNHHKAACVKRHGATHIHVHLELSERKRLDEETDLCRRWNPPCNG